MVKKVFGIILTASGGVSLLCTLIFGIIFGSLGNFISKNGEDMANAAYKEFSESCEGLIVDTTGSDTLIEYEVNGKTYYKTLSVHYEKYEEGDYVTVYYDGNDPVKCSIPELTEFAVDFVGTMFSTMGLVYVVIFGVSGVAELIVGIVLLKSYKKSRMNKLNNPGGPYNPSGPYNPGNQYNPYQ